MKMNREINLAMNRLTMRNDNHSEYINTFSKVDGVPNTPVFGPVKHENSSILSQISSSDLTLSGCFGDREDELRQISRNYEFYTKANPKELPKSITYLSLPSRFKDTNVARGVKRNIQVLKSLQKEEMEIAMLEKYLAEKKKIMASKVAGYFDAQTQLTATNHKTQILSHRDTNLEEPSSSHKYTRTQSLNLNSRPFYDYKASASRLLNPKANIFRPKVTASNINPKVTANNTNRHGRKIRKQTPLRSHSNSKPQFFPQKQIKYTNQNHQTKHRNSIFNPKYKQTKGKINNGTSESSVHRNSGRDSSRKQSFITKRYDMIVHRLKQTKKYILEGVPFGLRTLRFPLRKDQEFRDMFPCMEKILTHEDALISCGVYYLRKKTGTYRGIVVYFHWDTENTSKKIIQIAKDCQMKWQFGMLEQPNHPFSNEIEDTEDVSNAMPFLTDLQK